MKTKKTQLANEPLFWENEIYCCELSFSTALNKFCVYFNGKLDTYKTFNGANNKAKYYVEKYELIENFKDLEQ